MYDPCNTLQEMADRVYRHTKVSTIHFYNGTACIEWTKYTNKGYGRITINGDAPRMTHRVILAAHLNRELSKETTTTVDHLCRNTICCNPLHLEEVPHVINIARGNTGLHEKIKTHCPYGHIYDEKNTHIRPSGKRYCRACARRRARERRAK